ncbi:MAG: hypothetical protein JOZ42_02345 [Acetobacteraceae bacterium]|nr:hypothetical protein [Acetobacteraceae bacterium]
MLTGLTAEARHPNAPASGGRKAFEMLRQSIGHPGLILTASAIGVLAYFVRMWPNLPEVAMKTGDSDAYFNLESFRPPLYGWILNGWQWLHGSLDGLPELQLCILMLTLFAFAAELGLLLRNALVAVAVVPLAMFHPGIWEAPGWMMTESVYVSLVFAGMAAQFHYARNPGVAPLMLAGLCFGLATILRSTGLLFLLLPVGAALFNGARPFASSLKEAGAALAVALCLIVGAMSWNASRHGHFEIGSWSGISLLTKALLLTEPDDARGFPPLEAVAHYAPEERALIAAQPDLAARLRAQVQVASTDLRWGVFVPEAEKTWPAWQDADWRGRGLLAQRVSEDLIRRHPLGAARLWFNDWLAMLVQPAYWPSSWSTMTPDPAAFLACRESDNCWALQRYDAPLPKLSVLLVASAVAPLAAIVLIVLRGVPTLRRRTSAITVLFVLTACAIHATLLATAAFEAGNVRYTVALHVLELPLLFWLAFAAADWMRSVTRVARSSAV